VGQCPKSILAPPKQFLGAVAAGPALLQAKESGVSVIIKEAMANGRLTPRNTDPAFAGRLKLLCDTAQQVGGPPTEWL
jgi:hypothetical protein